MQTINRRAFLKLANQLLVASGAAVVLGPIIAYFYPTDLQEVPSEPVLVGSQADLPAGTSQTVRYGRYPALVINTSSGLRAYSAVCTHFACIVKWDPASGQIACPCHAGYFDPQDGSVLAGPPPSPLPVLPVNVVDGQVYIGGAE
jgi:Rieske Fe-S protein